MRKPSPWECTQPERFTLASDEVHLWLATLEASPAQLAAYEQLLSSDERERAARFRFWRDRHRYVVGRGLLRVILARYLGIAPFELRFAYNAYGKPEPAAESSARWLRFNLSHSHGLALYAVARGRELGVDIERVRPEMATEAIARHFFSPREVRALSALPPSAQTDAFFRCWTRKEAYLKARGEGLSLPLDSFEVSLAPGEPAVLLQAPGPPQERDRWSLRDVAVPRGYAAAVAVEGHGWRLCCRHWPKK
ncbi:MAG: 4'-phosphopantetheinyl transferase superfamily protein [Chloroflexi bacterium]|nr:4'-phosphopantetheinyl transferase superfamily protein [Chloroflexota bacterium]